MEDPAERRPAVFLDRDGTIIVDRHYLASPEQVELLPGAARALGRFQQAGYVLVVITNQSGIARGLFGEPAYRAVQARLEQVLAARGVTLNGAWFCPHHPDFTGPCECRKPGLRLFREAAETLAIDLPRSVFVGDRLHDVQPAKAFGGTAILVKTGYGAAEAGRAESGIAVVDDLRAAAEYVLGPETAG
jgi:D-glycero-D-manno-heptose 1,7-bisphosphate phosphatase